MNTKKLLFFAFLSAGLLLLFGNKPAISQVNNSKESYEDIYQHWFYAIDKFQSAAGLNKEDFNTFIHFSEKPIDSLRGDFMNKIGGGKVTLANVKDYESILVKALNAIYKNYEKIEQLFPSSVAEYRNYKPLMAQVTSQTCNPGCDNIDFSTGDLTGWYAYYGFNSSASSFNITNIAGGLAGPVKHAANDLLTSTPGYYIPASGGCDGPNPNPDYQVNITSGSRGDALVPSIPVVSPLEEVIR